MRPETWASMRCLTCRGDYLAQDDDGLAYCLRCRANVFVTAEYT